MVGQFDVDRQCRHRQPRARYGGRPLPPDACQPRHHAAPRRRNGAIRRRQLEIAFADTAHFAVHDAVPPSFGDEGAANHMRFCEGHGAPGVEVFVYGRPGGQFPARQHEQASRAVARLHGLDPGGCVFIEQNPAAIEAGAFHNDVVRWPTSACCSPMQEAFADQQAAYDAIRAAFPALEVVEVPPAPVSAGRSDPHLSLQRAVADPARRRNGADRARRMPRKRERLGLGPSECWPATDRSGRSFRSMCASRWPMAAAPPACACAWSPIPRRWMRASCWTRTRPMLIEAIIGAALARTDRSVRYRQRRAGKRSQRSTRRPSRRAGPDSTRVSHRSQNALLG